MPQLKPIEGFTGYFIRDDGKVFNSMRRVGMGTGFGSRIEYDGPLKEMKLVYARRYWHVKLWHAGKVKSCSVHSLVLIHFVGPRPKGMEARHLDGNRNHNGLDNLAWGTSQENQSDRILHGTSSRGSQNGNNKLVEAQVKIIKSHSRGPWAGDAAQVQANLANEFGITKRTVRDIWRSRTWGWL